MSTNDIVLSIFCLVSALLMLIALYMWAYYGGSDYRRRNKMKTKKICVCHNCLLDIESKEGWQYPSTMTVSEAKTLGLMTNNKCQFCNKELEDDDDVFVI